MVWGINKKGRILWLRGLSKEQPIGTDWKKTPDGHLKQISVNDPHGEVWGVNKHGSVYVRKNVEHGGKQYTAF